MNRIYVVYFSSTGNTKAMAEAIVKGVNMSGQQGEIAEVAEFDAEKLKEQKVFALGCSAMGAEELDDVFMEPLVEEIESSVKGKKIALFGSYGWGDGEWMRKWEDRLVNNGAEIVNNEGLICTDYPEDDVLDQCVELGKTLGSLLD